ncbi:MAG TPA: protein-disulfide reductase DsbD domain-containing protein [Thermoanaerobaculia bacterium]|nr:protein-disulfide reductase DsbD domain-containing protein [Thermoanaerobaculia bacterium]
MIFRTSSASRAVILLLAFGGVAPAAGGPDVRAKLAAPPAVAAGAKTTIAVEMTIGPGWHVNSHTPSEPYLIPTAATLTASAGSLSPVRYAKDEDRKFAFSDKPLRVYTGTVRFETDLDVPAGASGDVTVEGNLSYQACNDQQCFPPAKIPLKATAKITSR